MVVYGGYQQLRDALSICLNERREPEAMGLFAKPVEVEFLATLLLLRDTFGKRTTNLYASLISKIM